MIQNSIKPLRIKFLVKSSLDDYELSNKTKTLFKLLNIYIAYDFGFFNIKSKIPRILLKSYSLVFCFSISIVCILTQYENGNIQMILSTSYVLRYMMYVLILTFSKSTKSFSDFQKDLFALDAEMNVDSNTYKLDFKMMSSLLFFVSLRFSLILMNWYSNRLFMNSAVLLRSFLFIPPLLGNDVMIVMYMIVFYSVNCRVRKFTDYIKDGEIDTVCCEYLYKMIVDTTEEIMKTFEPAVSIIVFIFLSFGRLAVDLY